jgi:methionyl aminopeptidase
MAKTVVAGKAKSPEDLKLLKVTAESLEKGIKKAIKGNYTGDIGYEIQNFVENNGFSIVKALVGHGIGRKPHQDPQVPNYGSPKKGFRLDSNIAIAIEPMVNIGSSEVIVEKDGWTIKTLDGSRSAHFEHTILITNKNPLIVTS